MSVNEPLRHDPAGRMSGINRTAPSRRALPHRIGLGMHRVTGSQTGKSTREPRNIATVALTTKLGRAAWSMLNRNQVYRETVSDLTTAR